LQASRGWVAQPGTSNDSLQHGIASAFYRRGTGGRRFETLLACGRKEGAGHGASDACLWDISLDLHETHALFGRFERLDPGGTNEETSHLRLGYEYSWPLWDRFTIGFRLTQHETLASDTPDSRAVFLRLGLM
jgi:hypothetical protein